MIERVEQDAGFTPTEANIYAYLKANRLRVISADELMREAMGFPNPTNSSELVRAHMVNVRSKIAALGLSAHEVIVLHRRLGYRWDDPGRPLDSCSVHERILRAGLTSAEFQIVSYFRRHPGAPVPYYQLIVHALRDSKCPTDITVQVHVGHIRRKLGRVGLDGRATIRSGKERAYIWIEPSLDSMAGKLAA